MKFQGVKKLILAACSCALLVVGATTLVGCGPSTEETIRNGLTQEFEQIKSLDENVLAELSSSAETEDLAAYGIDPKEFFTAYLTGFDYRIDNVAVSGDKATATVAITCKSYTDYFDAFTAAVNASLEDGSVANLSDEELNAFIGQIVMDTLNNLTPHETAPFDITYERVNGIWSPTAEGSAAIEAALFG